MKDKGIFYAILGGTIFLIVIFFVGKTYGKNKPPVLIPIPDDEPGTTVSNFDPTQLTDRLYKDIEGWTLNVFDRDMDAWTLLASLSDSDFTKVLNDWNQRYYNKFSQSLYQAYQGEKFNPLTSANLLDTLTKRFIKLDKTKK